MSVYLQKAKIRSYAQTHTRSGGVRGGAARLCEVTWPQLEWTGLLRLDEGPSSRALVCRSPLRCSCCAFARRRPFWTLLLTLAFAWLQMHLFFFWVAETRPSAKARRDETRRDQRLLGCELGCPSCVRTVQLPFRCFDSCRNERRTAKTASRRRPGPRRSVQPANSSQPNSQLNQSSSKSVSQSVRTDRSTTVLNLQLLVVLWADHRFRRSLSRVEWIGSQTD